MDNKYENVILELFSRVKSLEERVQFLEEKLNDYVDMDDQEMEQKGEQKITRSMARQFVINKINEQYPNLHAIKGNRASGADIIIEVKNNPNKSLKVKFYYSKSYLEHVSSWHTVSVEDINNNDIDLYIFTVSHQQDFHTFLFTHSDIKHFVVDKSYGNSNLYHFYFHKKHNKIVEVRDHEKDASTYYERWEIIKDLI
jgi:hypothetical protein